MDQNRLPSPHLVHGLRKLVYDLNSPDPLQGHGLSGINFGSTDLISFHRGSVQYCGEPVEKLLANGSFEEVIWLLLCGELPTEDQQADIQAIISDAAVIDSAAAEMLDRIPLGTRALDLFPLSISLLSFFDPTPHDQNFEAARSRVWRLLSQLPVMLAAGLGKPLHDGVLLDPSRTETLSWAGRLLYCLRNDDVLPTCAEDAAMNAVMISQCLTEIRPACFAARFAGSTVNHIVAALQSAAVLFVSQLRNDPFAWSSQVLLNLQGPADAEEWLKQREGQPMPFGFGALTEDPRPVVLRECCHGMLGSHRRIVMEASACRLEKRLREKELYPTTDWMSARLMTLLNIPPDRQAVVVGMARLVGWAAQAMEQQVAGVSLLPSITYGSLESVTP